MIATFAAASRARPDAMILGVPQFGPDAPALRVGGRRISNGWVGLETLWAGIGDSLFGFRVYPVAPLLRIMERQRWMRRYDFDAEAAVRLCWAGVPAVNLPAPVRYLTPEEGGVTHFRYGRDNVLLTWMHTRLMLGFLMRLPLLAWRRARPPATLEAAERGCAGLPQPGQQERQHVQHHGRPRGGAGAIAVMQQQHVTRRRRRGPGGDSTTAGVRQRVS